MGMQTMFWGISLCQTAGQASYNADNECFGAVTFMMGKKIGRPAQ